MLNKKQEEGLKLCKIWWDNEKNIRPFVITGYAGCLDKESLILTDKGTITLKKLLESSNQDLNFIGQKEYKGNIKVFNGKKFTNIEMIHITDVIDGYEILLDSGLTIKCSYKHPLLTIKNSKITWIKSKDLKINDYIATIGNKNIYKNNKFKLLEDYYYMGYYQADGYLYRNKRFQFTSKDENKLKDFINYLYNNNFIENKPKIIFRKDKNNFNISFTSNKYKNLIKEIGFDVKNKIIPIEILDDENKKYSYLKGLFNDIGIGKNGITFSSIHKTNCIYVMNLCREFGVIFINLKEKINKSGSVYQITMLKESYNNFYEIFGNFIGKKNNLSLENLINNSKKLNTNKNLIPNLEELYSFKSNRYIINKLHPYDFSKRGRKPSYNSLKLLNEIYYKNSNKDLNYILETEYYYDKIVSIKPIKQQFYDITVPEENCFISNSIVSHNSGKTHLINNIIEALNIPIEEVAFVCFTGKAASVLNRRGLPATTIHKLIYNYEEDKKNLGEFKFNLKSFIDNKIKLIVIDELSMVEKSLLKDLMSFNKPIIGCGDPFQLQPVGGDINDIIKSPDIFLDEVMRQALDSPILYLANKVRHKENINFGSYGDLVKVISKNHMDLDDMYSADQILAGKNQTVTNVNKFYRTIFLETDSKLPIKGEKVICLRNNYDIEITENGISQPLVNGLNCYVKNDININDINETNQTFMLNLMPDYFNDVEYKDILIDKIYFDKNIKDDKYIYDHIDEYSDVIQSRKKLQKIYLTKINKFTFGYCITVHKSQGSQFNKVFLINEYLNRDTYYNWLYTGITRAEKELIIAK